MTDDSDIDYTDDDDDDHQLNPQWKTLKNSRNPIVTLKREMKQKKGSVQTVVRLDDPAQVRRPQGGTGPSQLHKEGCC